MNVVLLGMSKESLHLAKLIRKSPGYPHNNGLKLYGVLCRDTSQTTTIAVALNTRAFICLEDALRNADVLLISHPDSRLAQYSEILKNHNVRNKILCHFSEKYDSKILSCGVTNSCYSITFPFMCDTDKTSDLVNTPVVVEGYGKRDEEFRTALGNSIANLKFCTSQEKALNAISRRATREYLKKMIDTSEHLFKISGTYDKESYNHMLMQLFAELTGSAEPIPKLEASELKKNLRLLSAVDYNDTLDYVRNMEAHIVMTGSYSLEEKEALLRVLKVRKK